MIIFIHELGHIIFFLIFKANIKKINIYPFGGYILFDNVMNNLPIKELFISIGGILFQLILYLVFNIINVSEYTYNIFNNYNTSIILFNLLPIIPLDGSKMLNILLNFFIPFKKTHIITIYISYVVIILFLIVNLNINSVIISILCISLIIKEYKNHIYIFNKFLVERYLKKNTYKKNYFINKIIDMKKYNNNILIKNNKYYCEKEFLTNKYKHID